MKNIHKYLHRRLNNLLLLDLLPEHRVKQEGGGAVVDQPGRLLQDLQVCPLLTHSTIRRSTSSHEYAFQCSYPSHCGVVILLTEIGMLD